jgi:hypothetical protein
MALSARGRYFGYSWFIAGSMMKVARSMKTPDERPLDRGELPDLDPVDSDVVGPYSRLLTVLALARWLL